MAKSNQKAKGKAKARPSVKASVKKMDAPKPTGKPNGKLAQTSYTKISKTNHESNPSRGMTEKASLASAERNKVQPGKRVYPHTTTNPGATGPYQHVGTPTPANGGGGKPPTAPKQSSMPNVATPQPMPHPDQVGATPTHQINVTVNHGAGSPPPPPKKPVASTGGAAKRS